MSIDQTCRQYGFLQLYSDDTPGLPTQVNHHQLALDVTHHSTFHVGLSALYCQESKIFHCLTT